MKAAMTRVEAKLPLEWLKESVMHFASSCRLARLVKVTQHDIPHADSGDLNQLRGKTVLFPYPKRHGISNPHETHGDLHPRLRLCAIYDD